MKGNYDLVIIGGGPAGLAAAVAAYDSGVEDILILEREPILGGILNQCIHNGFGLTRFKESLSGPEYAARFISEVEKRSITVLTNTAVLSLDKGKLVTAMNAEEGVFTVQAKAVILAMGCRERSRGALNVAGSRAAGVYSAGTAQKYVNVFGYMPGKRVVILGSGDIGLIMARRMTLEGAKVLAVCEIMPQTSGLKRNIAQCLDDFGIPLYLNHTVTKIEGDERVTGVVVSKVDENRKPIAGTEIHFDCDTVLFSVGLIPENELTKGAGIELSRGTRGAVVTQSRETSESGVFACGNVLQVHDLVDFVSEEAEIAGVSAARYILGGEVKRDAVEVKNGKNILYVCPQLIDKSVGGKVKLFFRVTDTFKAPTVTVRCGNGAVQTKKLKVAVPGEMQSIVLSEETVRGLNGSVEVLVEVDQ
ncbi:MAG: FAD-dependent oxidoreductase [Clostridia bacterium]|nr:FAD-dependent oxidoreductase [Clostridia bacterium]MBR2968953.1 FAD-dependent oxidoreductase [Clostridia bacterium]